MNSKGFSIIIPTYNRAELLRTALAGVQALRVPEGWAAEVLVIDNNSADDTAAVIEQSARSGPLDVHRVLETRQGLNHGRNRGLAEARFEHLVYFDDDIQADSGWLEGYVEARAALSADCVVGPVEPWFEGEIPDWVSPRVLDSVTSAYSRKGEALVLLGADAGHEIPGCNFAVRKEVACAVGGFHPKLDRSGERMLAGGDWEFAERLISLDKQIVYTPRCRTRHFVSSSKLSKDNLRKRWTGLGATQRALMKLRRQNPPFRHQARLFLRMNRFFLRSARCRLSGDSAGALRWELEALRIRGSLFARLGEIEPRSSLPSGGSETQAIPRAP